MPCCATKPSFTLSSVVKLDLFMLSFGLKRMGPCEKNVKKMFSVVKEKFQMVTQYLKL
jgi:hypothetical protein